MQGFAFLEYSMEKKYSDLNPVVANSVPFTMFADRYGRGVRFLGVRTSFRDFSKKRQLADQDQGHSLISCVPHFACGISFR